jgi:hypothetical protein
MKKVLVFRAVFILMTAMAMNAAAGIDRKGVFNEKR